MKITTVEQLVELENLISSQNVEAGKKLLADGGEMWVFRSVEELEADKELTSREKEECKKIFPVNDGKWAGWYRAPKKRTTLHSRDNSLPRL
jgi:hypothetical protein